MNDPTIPENDRKFAAFREWLAIRIEQIAEDHRAARPTSPASSPPALHVVGEIPTGETSTDKVPEDPRTIDERLRDVLHPDDYFREKFPDTCPEGPAAALEHIDNRADQSRDQFGGDE